MVTKSGVFRFLVVLALIAASTGLAFAGDYSGAPQLVLDPSFHASGIRDLAVSGDGKLSVSVGDDKTARLYDASGRLLKVFRVPIGPGNEGKLYACALSKDGRLLALAGWTGWDVNGRAQIYLLDTSSGKILRRVEDLPDVVLSMDMYSDNGGAKYLAFTVGSSGLYVANADTGAVIFKDSDYADNAYSARFSANGQYIACCAYDHYLRLYECRGSNISRLVKKETDGDKLPSSTGFGQDGSTTYLAMGYEDVAKIDVYRVANRGLSFAYNPPMPESLSGGFRCLDFKNGRSGLSLMAGGLAWINSERPLLVWKSFTAQPATYSVANSNAVTAIVSADGDTLVASYTPTLYRFDDDFSNCFDYLSPLADFREMDSKFRLSYDGAVVDFAYKLWGSQMAEFSLLNRVIGPELSLGEPNTKGLNVSDWRNTPSPKINGKPLSLQSHEKSRSYAISPDNKRVIIGCDWHTYCFDASGVQQWSVTAPSSIWAAAISGNGLLAAVACGDGTVRWYRLDNGKELLAFFPHGDGKRWLAWTPSGYYVTSPGAEEIIGWHINNGQDSSPDFFPISRFRSTFYRPDVVNLILTTMDESQALIQANALTGKSNNVVNISTQRPPIVSIISPYDGSNFDGSSVSITYRLSSPSDAPVTKVRALIDGRPVEGMKAISLSYKSDADLTIEVPVPSQTCIVSLIADNRNGPSDAASVQLVRKANAQFVIKPKLYVLSVGVSDYDNHDYRLNYAAKDAQDLAGAFKRLEGGIYREVVTKVLTNKDASKDGILDGLDWIEKETTSKDVAVIYFSGHGINDPNQNYYYLPVEANVDKLKRSGVPFSDITTTISGINGKVLFFIDTCHSGNISKGTKSVANERDIVAVVNELSSTENGAIVFASSTGSQYSYEDASWGNGAFTKAIIEGLSGKAVVGGSDTITVNMLDLYISERVKQLTKGKQTPTTTKPANIPDFPVALR